MGRKLGQHFLKDEGVLRQIAYSLGIESSDIIVEIGPGHGELTNELRIMNYESRIIAIEKDEKLVQVIRKKFASDKNIEIIQGDALKILPSLIRNSNYKVVGNIPYYITGYLLRILGELENKPSLIVLTIQKEVAERICAKPPKMNLLAASVQFWAQPKIIDLIKKAAFNPQPEVDSAIIKLVPKKVIEGDENYYKLIKSLFKQPRKTILNNIFHGMKISKEKTIEKFTKQDIQPNARPQNLTIQSLIALSNVFRDEK